jgi:predicted deacetylase
MICRHRRAAYTALVSIHDVMPSTLDRVERLVRLTERFGVRQLTLLVVPGVEWRKPDLVRLRRWQDAGYRLAGHGWRHRCDTIRGWRHRLHSWLISRHVAEHLELPPDRVVTLVNRCREWFDRQGFEPPGLYVPPAWALGNLSPNVIRSLPFSLIETLWGVIDVRRYETIRLPLIGFEADSLMRQLSLSCLNRVNRFVASRGAGVLRLALHPRDLELRMGSSVYRHLALVSRSLDYGEIAGAGAGTGGGGGSLPASAGDGPSVCGGGSSLAAAEASVGSRPGA